MTTPPHWPKDDGYKVVVTSLPRPRHGYRRWKRFICRLVGHDPWYSATRKNWYGLIVAYKMNCWRCGEEIDAVHPEEFTP